MSNSPSQPPAPDEALRLFQRHLAGDPTATNDLAVAFLQPLIDWLGVTHRRAPADLREEAAGRALVALLHNPQSFTPGKMSLEAYLRMSARGDLRNLLARERKHFVKRVPWKNVELSPDVGKYLGRDDDPSLPLQMEELDRQAAADEAALDRAAWSDQEWEALKLMQQQERRTAVYAEKCGLTHLPLQEQQREVKRLKDRIKKRRERAGGSDDPSR